MTFQNSARRIAVTFSCAIALVAGASASRAAITSIPGLTGVRIWEFSGGANLHAYTPFAPQLLAQLGTLNTTTNDFLGNPVEPYDVFYSDIAGNPNPAGNWVTAEARYPAAAPFGGGLNLGAVDLVFGASFQRADILGSWVGLGTNYLAGSEVLAVDPIDTPVVPTTATTMGNTAGSNTARMRVTVGWKQYSVPEPTGIALVLGGAAALCTATRKHKKGLRA